MESPKRIEDKQLAEEMAHEEDRARLQVSKSKENPSNPANKYWSPENRQAYFDALSEVAPDVAGDLVRLKQEYGNLPEDETRIDKILELLEKFSALEEIIQKASAKARLGSHIPVFAEDHADMRRLEDKLYSEFLYLKNKDKVDPSYDPSDPEQILRRWLEMGERGLSEKELEVLIEEEARQLEWWDEEVEREGGESMADVYTQDCRNVRAWKLGKMRSQLREIKEKGNIES